MNGVFRSLLFSVAIAFCSVSGAIPSKLSATNLIDGKPYSVSLRDPAYLGTTVVFVSAECPCSVSHQPTLSELSKKFPKFNFVAVFSNSAEDLNQAKAHFAAAQLPFPVLVDMKQTLANEFGALKTPHAFVISPEGHLLYRGGVDDSHDTTRAKKHYLADALSAIQRGQKPDPSETRVLGCVISR